MSKIDKDWIEMIEGERGQIREQDLYPKLNRWASNRAFEKILDIGCGQGICSQKIDLGQGHYTGIDSSELLIKRASEIYNTANTKFLVADALDLPFDDASFDAVFSISLIHLIEDVDEVIDELSRVLKPKGRFFLVTAAPSFYESWEDSYKEKSLEGKRFIGKRLTFDGTEVEDTLYFHEGEEIHSALEDAGLEIEDIEPFRNFIAIRGKKV
jgi:ubiquinone/menaquinone biosynthesis C-methylase UbiE